MTPEHDANATDFILAWLRRIGRLTMKAQRESTTDGDGRFSLTLTFASLEDLVAAAEEFDALAAMAEEDAAAAAEGRPPNGGVK